MCWETAPRQAKHLYSRAKALTMRDERDACKQLKPEPAARALCQHQQTCLGQRPTEEAQLETAKTIATTCLWTMTRHRRPPRPCRPQQRQRFQSFFDECLPLRLHSRRSKR